MKIAKDGIRSIVKVGYDGRVHKTFRGTDKEIRFANEVKVLKALEARGCDFVPQLLESDEETLTIITTNCGAPAESTISEEKAQSLFQRLDDEYGIVHDDPFARNITYDGRQGQFCVIDFELAEIKAMPGATEIENVESDEAHRILSWCGLTRDGTRKPGNQDALSVFSLESGSAKNEELLGDTSIDENGIIFAVSDGMGGPNAGDVASTLVVRELHRFLPAMLGDFHGTADPAGLLNGAVKSLHDYVSRVGNNNEKFKGMGATVVCGLFFHTVVHFAHVGDSRFYLFRKGELKQLTHDHSYLGSKFRSGKLNEREVRMHPHRNVLEQAIGGGCRKVSPQVASCRLEHGDWFLICSDGVVDGLWNKNIAQAFEEAEEKGSSAEEVATRILDWATREAGADDTTLFVVKVV
ncbi:MAG: protein phosphatase 2C domain-containing protein [Verrucomicrobiales bacterium]|nr:protein phosphatase 2C domain-containing protein [Verrucomicrobiales bacterium]